MGNLRARNENEKAIKRKAILDAAWLLLKHAEGQLPTVIEIANHAKISKGTVYVYFKTKEEIFLDLFVTKLREWFDDFNKKLQRIKKPTIESISYALAQYPAQNPLLLVLGSLLHGVLEKNAPFNAVLEMKLQVARIAEECGLLFNQYLPWLPPRQGAKFMLTAYTVFNGIFQSASSPQRLKKELKKRNIDIFEVDINADMVNAGIVLLEGMRAILST